MSLLTLGLALMLERSKRRPYCCAEKHHGLNVWSLDCITPHGEIKQVQEFLLHQPHKNVVFITHQPLISSLIGYFCHADEHMGEAMMPALWPC